MTKIAPTIQTFVPPSISQVNRQAQGNNSLNLSATVISGKVTHRPFDKTSTAIQIDNESLSTFPVPETASALSVLLSGVVSVTPNVSPLTSQSTSPNPNVASLMSPKPDSPPPALAPVYA